VGKNIVVCMDGTWNDPTEKTNVHKLFSLFGGTLKHLNAESAICEHEARSAIDLQAFYLQGVGAHGRSEGLLGGVFGVGLHDRVIDAFVLVSRAYTVGDKLWVFGFSRGAWAARSLAGLIVRAGLLEAVEANKSDAWAKAEVLWFQSKHEHGYDGGKGFWKDRDDKPIKLVGVWDTVGALGIPFFNGLKSIDRFEKNIFDFADCGLSALVEHGRHALAIDETRKDFEPTLWKDRENVVQVWFSGVHADVGGGYQRCGLSDIALTWMVDQVNGLNAGLNLDTAFSNLSCNALQDRHDEARKTMWKLRPRSPRILSTDSLLHPSVEERLAGRADYRPAALSGIPRLKHFYTGTPVEEKLLDQKDTLSATRLQEGATMPVTVFSNKWWNASGLEVKEGERYSIKATGKWKDKEYEATADGYPSPNVLLRQMESTRRVKDANWFALIAAVHGGEDLEAKNPDTVNFVGGFFESLRHSVGAMDEDSQLVTIGSAGNITVNRNGFLYLFANDTTFAYSNNSLYVTVDVTRK
jgi:uncharacterized protein (DUF2235 family)